jgi:hypothetical protein
MRSSAGGCSEPATRARGILLDFGGLAASLCLFSFFALRNLHLPGLYQDEALDVAPAVRLLVRHDVWPYSLMPGSLALPLMVCDHVGPTSTYLMLPFLWWLGPGLTAVRTYEFIIGLAALVTIFLWARRVLPAGAAGVAALLLAPMPSLWLACRNGLHVSFIVVPLAAGALAALDMWHTSRRAFWLCLGGFLIGVGLSTKILFLWFLVALAVGVLVARPRALRELPRRQLGLAALWAIVGASPLIVFNVLSRGQTVRTILGSLSQTPYGVRNADVVANLRTQLGSFASILSGDWLTWTGAEPQNPLAIVFFVCAATCLLASCGRQGLRRFRFLLAALAVIVVESCFTISTLGPKHLVIVLPLSAVVAAGGLSVTWARRGRAGWLAAFIALSCLAVAQFAWQLSLNHQHLRSLSHTGGTGLFSSAHDRLATYLGESGIHRPLAGDWGFESNLETLTGGQVLVDQIIALGEPPPFSFTRERARATLGDPASVYIFHVETYAVAPGRLEAVREEAERLGVELKQIESFRDGLGRPVIAVYGLGRR